jgi:predicted metal-dependent phosphoesterase TrpH
MHTIMGSIDSNLSVEKAAKKIYEKDLNGACLTEHSSIWEKNNNQIEDIFNLYNLKVFRAIEISTDYGHIIAIGFDKYYSGSHNLELLRDYANKYGAFLISAHPARRIFGKEKYQQNLLYKGKDYIPSVDEFSSNKLFKLVDGVEVLNGGNNLAENKYAYIAAKNNELVMTAGTDAHSESGIGLYGTRFNNEIKNVQELVFNLKNNYSEPVLQSDNAWIELDLNYYNSE